MALHRVVVVAFVLLLAGCGSKKPSAVKGVPPAPPDESYQLGSIGYQEGFLWTCAASEPPKSERLAMKYGALGVSYVLKTIDTFVPPKPNEFDIA